jgi:hypothetical protein
MFSPRWASSFDIETADYYFLPVNVESHGSVLEDKVSLEMSRVRKDGNRRRVW